MERQNQIDFHPNQHGGGAGKPHIDWRLAETDLSTGLKCVAVMERSDLDLTGRERLLGCRLESSVDICQSVFIREFQPSSVEMCEETVQARCEVEMRREARNQTVERCYTPVSQPCPPDHLSGDTNSLCYQLLDSSCVRR